MTPAGLLLIGLLLAGCSFGERGSTPQASGPAVIVTVRSTASSTPPAASAWVLAPVGLNLRAEPSATSARLATIGRGVQLDVLGAQAGWLRVRPHDRATEGWVVDDPTLVSRRAMTVYSASVEGWSILYPATWKVQPGSPTTFSGDGATLTVQFASDPKDLAGQPGSPGTAVRDEGPLEVYGITTFLTVYRLDAGGWEYDDRARISPSRVVQFRYRDPSSQADTTLFKQLLSSVALQ